ncbi:diadenylate cyclase CdaA [Clostridium sp. E02]|uniref:diadenylate cyclase CdaA n=1 Tax=Clostridium sp. E02 TaxID=2487134 RepID=UPI000F528AED|nr:diadenylate cyclase CdaA [Clostridium sp. E02]
MADFLGGMYSWVSFLPRISKTNLVEIVIIAILLYELLTWIMNTRAWTLLKGIIMILLFYLFAYVFRLYNIFWILNKIATPAVTMAIVIFQPELRKVLEQLGSKNPFTGILTFDDGRTRSQFTDKTINELVKATYEMAKVKTGALIVIERSDSLKEIERTGIEVGGIVSSQLLINIFEHNTPLHDGAVVIRGNRVAAATCYLPLTDNMTISKDLGTRHRAAVGVSEVSDSVTIVVSEETGRVIVAMEGGLKRIADADMLKSVLGGAKQAVEEGSRFRILKGRRKNEEKNIK